MAVLHQRFLRRTHRAPLCSLATCFTFALAAVTLLLPFFLAYSSHGFWLKDNFYSEQPDAVFTRQVLLFAEGTDATGAPLTVAFTTESAVRPALGSAFRSARVETSETDGNNDGLADSISVLAELPLAAGESVHSVSMLLGLEVTLREEAKVIVPALAAVAESSALAGRRVDVFADLALRFRWPLSVLGGYQELYEDEPLFPEAGLVSAAQVAPRALLAAYAARNVTAHLDAKLASWQRAPDAPELAGSFVAAATLRVPTQRIWYTPLVSEVLKVGWIQYLSMLVVVGFVAAQLKGFVFDNQLLSTHVRVDGVKVSRL